MSDPMTVTPERVVEILCRDPLGAALWRAAVAEATCETYQKRIGQLEQQQGSAAT